MIRVMEGDCRAVLATLPERSIQCCVTSPPYYGLRDYGVDGQIGLEKTPDEYVAELVAVFREVRRVLRDDGVLWINIGDSYAQSGIKTTGRNDGDASYRARTSGNAHLQHDYASNQHRTAIKVNYGVKPKDLIGIPWMVAFALRADGWYLRSEVIWAKPNPMPESVTDRPTKAHEQVFLLSKGARYFYDADAIAEAAVNPGDLGLLRGVSGVGEKDGVAWHAPSIAKWQAAGVDSRTAGKDTRNARTIWTIATQPYSGAHFATMPADLAERCIKAGSAKGDTILDPFGGAGTTALVADRLGRNATIIELNPEYAALARERVTADAGMFAQIEMEA